MPIHLAILPYVCFSGYLCRLEGITNSLSALLLNSLSVHAVLFEISAILISSPTEKISQLRRSLRFEYIIGFHAHDVLLLFVIISSEVSAGNERERSRGITIYINPFRLRLNVLPNSGIRRLSIINKYRTSNALCDPLVKLFLTVK